MEESPQHPGSPSGAWCVLLGPGARLAALEPLARAACRQLAGAAAPTLVVLADLAELAQARGSHGRVVLDADVLPGEDLGYVRRFLATRSGWSLLLLGEDAGRRSARSVLALPRTRWLTWPLDLDQLEHLVRAPARGLSPARAADALVPGPPLAAAPFVPHVGLDLAALADAAEHLERTHRALREGDASADEDLEAFALGLADLRRTARTLSLLAAPPGPAESALDLGQLLEDELAASTLRGRKAPRFLYRGAEGLEVQAEREALTLAVQSLLLLARGCTAPGEVIRVELLAPELESGRAQVRIDFEAPALEGVEPERALEPHALRDALPELGPNDLAAARSVAQALGGGVELARLEGRAWRATLELPVRLRSVPASGAHPATPGEDPFA